MSEPKITVYIPSHNYGKYLDRAIQSVQNQTMSDWELVVIDDGSTDNTRQVLKKYKNLPKIRIIEQENKGLNVTNNIALRLANGKYIIRLDADDYFDENILLILSNVLDTKPNIDLVFPDYYHVDENGEVLEVVRRKKIGEEAELLDLPAHGAGTMIRREILLELKGYDEEFSCQDGYGLWLKFIQSYNPYNVNIPLFYYRQHPLSLTKKQEQILETRKKIKEQFVNTYQNNRRPRILGVIPVVGKSIYPQSQPFSELAGKPLLWYTLKEVVKANNLDLIALSSDEDAVLDYSRKFKKIIPIKRPKKLAKPGSRIENIVRHVLAELKKSRNYEPDGVCILYMTTPLRRSHHIDKAVDTMTIFNVDSVISIQEELSYFYLHGKNGLDPLSRSSRDLRVERDAIFRENGALYLTRIDVIRKGRILGEKIGHITMLPEESIKVNSEFDFWMAEKIITDWKKRGNKHA